MQYSLIKYVKTAQDEERDNEGDEEVSHSNDPKYDGVAYFFKHIFGKQKESPALPDSLRYSYYQCLTEVLPVP